MKSLWPSGFRETDVPSMRSILEEQFQFLTDMTNGRVDGEVVALDGDDYNVEVPLADFMYRFSLIGRYIQNYRFRVFSFSHDVTLYPVQVSLDTELQKEFQLPTHLNGVTLGSPAEAEKFLGEVFHSDRIKKVIGAILKLSR